MRRLVLDGKPAAELKSLATATPTVEVCGLLAGSSDGQVTRIFPLPSHGGSRTFFADPYAQYLAEKEIERSGLTILAIYHTHPDGGPSLSKEDLEFANAWDCAHLVIAVDSTLGKVRAMRAFAIVAGAVVEVPVVPDVGR